MDCLVLGGSRFIGLHLVYALAQSGHRVTVLNRGLTQAEHPEGTEQIKADRLVPADMARGLGGRSFDVALDVSGWGDEEVRISAEALAGVVGHYVFTSSIVAYADAESLPVAEDRPLNRDPDASFYAKGKVAAEDILWQASQRHGYPVTMVRPPSVYGPHNYLVTREFAYFARLEGGRPIILPAHGRPLVHFVHAADVAYGLVLCMRNPAAYGQAFNVAGPEAVTLDGWVEAMAEVVGVRADVVYLPTDLEEYVEFGPGPPIPPESFPINWHVSAHLSIEKARRVLGYVPRYDLTAGIRQTYEWYRRQPADRWSWDFSRDDECLRKMKR